MRTSAWTVRRRRGPGGRRSGRPNAAVLPVPVRAWTTRLRPARGGLEDGELHGRRVAVAQRVDGPAHLGAEGERRRTSVPSGGSAGGAVGSVMGASLLAQVGRQVRGDVARTDGELARRLGVRTALRRPGGAQRGPGVEPAPGSGRRRPRWRRRCPTPARGPGAGRPWSRCRRPRRRPRRGAAARDRGACVSARMPTAQTRCRATRPSRRGQGRASRSRRRRG